MSTINAQENLFASLGLAASESRAAPVNNATDLGLNTFLKLMVTQLNNQDPFKPMENGDFLGQIAQFGSVTGLEQLNTSFESLAASITSGQALQAGSLVGREVLAPVDIGYLASGGSVRGQVMLDETSSNVTVRIEDQIGQPIKEIPMGSVPAGKLDFTWDGSNEEGGFAAEGLYRVVVEAEQGDQTVQYQTQLFSAVESVNLSARDGLTLNLEGLGPIAFNNVKQIY